MKRILCQGIARGEIGRKKQVWGPSPSYVALGLVWDGKGCAAEWSQAEGWVQLALLKQIPFCSRKHWPGLEKPGIWHPLLSLTSWLSLIKVFQFPTIEFSTWKTYLPEFCIPWLGWRAAQKVHVTLEQVSSQHCHGSAHLEEASWPRTANIGEK